MAENHTKEIPNDYRQTLPRCNTRPGLDYRALSVSRQLSWDQHAADVQLHGQTALRWCWGYVKQCEESGDMYLLWLGLLLHSSAQAAMLGLLAKCLCLPSVLGNILTTLQGCHHPSSKSPGPFVDGCYWHKKCICIATLPSPFWQKFIIGQHNAQNIWLLD